MHLSLQILFFVRVRSKNRPHLRFPNLRLSQYRKKICRRKLNFVGTSSSKENLTFVFSIRNQIMRSGFPCLKTPMRNLQLASLTWKANCSPLCMKARPISYLYYREEVRLEQPNQIRFLAFHRFQTKQIHLLMKPRDICLQGQKPHLNYQTG